DEGMTGEPLGKAVNTFVGSQQTNQYRFIVDFGGGPLAELAHDAPVKAVVSGLEGAKVLQQRVEWLGALAKWRLSFLVEAPADKNLVLRAFLKSEDRTLTETWTYTLPPNNRINANGG
ncbi:MAG: glucan biosynthesis protein, partial [Gammaproteobacteria bacterium]|nr:glucan biosynthesis protein [Gammaproteobacteria bacterium]